MADKLLSAADQEELSKNFAEVDRSFGLEAVTRMEQIAGSLTATPAGQAPGAGAAQPGNCGCGCTP